MSAGGRFVLAIVAAFLLSAVENSDILTALLCFTLTAFLYREYRAARFTQALRFLALFNLFTLFIWLTLPWRWQNGWHYSPEGKQLAWLLTLRINGITLLIRLLLYRFNEPELLEILRRRFIPPKFVRLSLLIVRYIKIFGETDRTLYTAMRARGFQPRFNRRTFYVTAQRVALLLIHAAAKAETVDMALRARGVSYEAKGKKPMA